MLFLTRYTLLCIFLIFSIFLLVHLKCSLKKKVDLDYQAFLEKLEKPQIDKEKVAELRERLLHPKPPEKRKNFNSTIGHRFYQPFAWKLLPKNNTCGPNVTTLIVVHSANQYSLYRKAIRETYGKKKYQEMFNYRLFFAEGKSENLTKEANLREEAAQYEDIIQADFLDSYRNLTIKYLMWMRYVRDFCPHTELVLKIDDDILVDIFWLFEEIRIKKISKERCFTCRLNQGNVIRDTTHKWYVSKDVMPEDAWNVYSSGIAVIQVGFRLLNVPYYPYY